MFFHEIKKYHTIHSPTDSEDDDIIWSDIFRECTQEFFHGLKRLIETANESNEVIIWSNDIKYFFPTFCTLVSDHISLIFLPVDPDRLHETMTCCRSISGIVLIHMLRAEAVWTVIAC